jgi:hypothetical protein
VVFACLCGCTRVGVGVCVLVWVHACWCGCMRVGVGACVLVWLYATKLPVCFINQPSARNSKTSTLSAVNSGVRLLVKS